MPPVVDAPAAIVKQPLTPKQKLRAFLRIADTSLHDGEVASALRMAGRLMAEAEMCWVDLLDSADQRDIAVEAAAVLQERVNELERRLAQYERGGGTAVMPWSDVGTAGNPQTQAAWCLAEHAAGRLYLNEFEKKFLPNIVNWTGLLTVNQQPVFDKIMVAVARRIGRKPPS